MMKQRVLATLFVLAAAGYPGLPRAGLTDITQLPLTTSSGAAVKPNLLYVMDTSGSMARSFMPDTLAGSLANNCSKNAITNGLYYNPAVNYVEPVDASGNKFPAASFTSAPYDGFGSSGGTIDLSTSFQAHDANTSSGSGQSFSDTAQPAYYYVYSGSAPLKSGDCAPDADYTLVVVSASSGPGGTDERQNFANWYSYYRTRILLSKTAMGRAFDALDSRYRVGFMTIYNDAWGGPNANYLPIADFDPVQRASFYTKLYAQQPNGDTPLQEALVNAGKLFQKNLPGAADPIQFSCQTNTAVLATDGYWNRPFNSLGNTDNAAARPFFDGGYGPAQNTLADVAYYYWSTDLRPAGSIGALGTDVSGDHVVATPIDPATWQHMQLHTIGLGANGTLIYQPDYDTATSGDYYNIATGAASGCAGLTPDNACNWPVPTPNTPTTIDDLWHAAVNGHGRYYSARDPTSLDVALRQILASLRASVGAQSAVTSSTPNLNSTENFAFSGSFTSVEWTGDVTRFRIDASTGAIAAIDWSAQPLLDARTSAANDTRSIHRFRASASSGLVRFDWTNLSAAEQSRFDASLLSQWRRLNVTQRAAATGEAMVDYLRGRRGMEYDANAPTAANSLFRARTHVLGDIINAQTVYVAQPLFNYLDSGYSAFKAANATRQPVVYAAANDGMLHAFNAQDGEELWAFVPSAVIPNLWQLADMNYGSTHRFSVDGTPVVGDIYAGGVWKTLLVGGLQAGGRAYYALDVTDPANPKGLWEFTDADLGLTFGNPIITKNQSGQWVVLVTSGYNNVLPGDGNGYLYVLDAATGAILRKIGTGVGSTTDPSGLAKIVAWADNTSTDNTMLRVYGGDLKGNLWRFDPDMRIAGNTGRVTALARFTDPAGNPQPITARPEVGDIGKNTSVPVVFVGTGQYLGITDLVRSGTETFYAVKDNLATTGYGAVRSASGFAQQTLTQTTDTNGNLIRTTSSNPVDLAGSSNGWFIDLPGNGERATSDATLDLGILTFTTNLTSANACVGGGDGWLNYVDFRTGTFIASSPGRASGIVQPARVLTPPSVVRLTNGRLVALTRGSDGATISSLLPPVSLPQPGRRLSWREIVSD